MTKHDILKCISYRIIILLIGSICGVIALLLVFCIPTENMQEHIIQSMPTLESEFENGVVIDGYTPTLKGNFTDCLMMENAIYVSGKHSLLERVLFVYRGESSANGWAPGTSLRDYIMGKELVNEVEYSRYWHGYLVFLKPILYFMNINSIRMLAAFLQIFLSIIILLLCCKRGEHELGVAYMFAITFLYFPFLYASLSLSICFYLLSLSVILQLKYNEKLVEKRGYGLFFFLVGMSTSYFDFLTYPLVTIGFPLCIYMYLNMSTWKDGIKKLICYSVEWGVGYIGFWAMKWIVTFALTGGNTIGNAVETISTRTGNAEGYTKIAGFLAVLKKNLGAYTNQAYLILMIIAALLITYIIIKSGREKLKTGFRGHTIVFVLIAMYPLAWFFVTQNHSDEHWMFTCKILAVSVFAIGCIVGGIVNEKDTGSFLTPSSPV